MNSALRLRIMTRADLPFADSVRNLAGWNQTPADWERFLALAADGCFLAEWNGAHAGTASTMVYGPKLAWIGMVLVHPDYRRRGIGRALLEQCIDHLRQRGVHCIKLDATPQGKTVYDGLGFKDEWTLTRWERKPGETPHSPADSRIRNWMEEDAEPSDNLNIAAFGVSRRELIRLLVMQAHGALVVEPGPGRFAGYGLLRRGSQAHYLGPVVAESPDAGTRIIEALLDRANGKRIFWDIPDQNGAAVSIAEQRGFTVQRTLTRMHLGENTAPGNPALQFAIAGPELG